MKRPILIALVLILCAVNAQAWTSVKVEKKPDSSLIQIYENSSLDRPFTIIGKGRVKGASPKYLARLMKTLAMKHGGDAVLKYKVENSGSVSYWTGGQVSYAEGVIIKLSDAGIKTITEKTIIPVIQ